MSGPLVPLRTKCVNDPSRNWVLYYPLVAFPKQFKSFQSAVFSALAVDLSAGDIDHDLRSKLVITLKSVVGKDSIPPTWQCNTKAVLKLNTSFIKMCWLKSLIGGWCTGVRLHSFHERQCIYGCLDCKDDLMHYLVCPILWQLAREVLCVQEVSFLILDRLCIGEPTEIKFKTLAFCHALYHCCVNDAMCMHDDGTPRDSRTVQLRAYENAHFCSYLVGGKLPDH